MSTLYSYPSGTIVNGVAIGARMAIEPCFVTINGIQHGPEICALWTAEALAEWGIKRVVCDALPTDANGWPYLPGEPVDVEGETEIQRSYPNATPDTEGWAAHLAALATALRNERDAKLTACDWLVIRHVTQTAAGADTTLTAAEYQELLTYLQALRDLTAQSTFPLSVTWPAAPSFVV